ncbi:hypothetical protein M9H77_27907 [Catharanthus roseus]|uniref:Uncharacterized protein n=1 Tax=Catharanthus roseus TaxID=4058 RepID=A0ACC0AFZ2_CATRO|nr:hypothetical protein M9H77_27907 [Catharanthus roseus]
MASSHVVSDNIMKNKVIIINGVNRIGKSRLSIDLATRFPSKIISSDKIQVYKGLDIFSNKAHISESSVDFYRDAIAIIETILKSNRVTLIVAGSNSFLEASWNFRSFECCLIWMDVSFPVLDSYVSKRVDQMVDANEVQEIFDEKVDYNRGVKRGIGVPEMHDCILLEAKLDKTRKDALLASSNLRKIHMP